VATKPTKRLLLVLGTLLTCFLLTAAITSFVVVALHMCRTPAPIPAPLGSAQLTGAPLVHSAAAEGDQADGSADQTSPAQGSPLYAVSIRAGRSLVNLDVTMTDGQAKAGTGIVLTSTGLVMTNYHVISGATMISAYDRGDDRNYRATVIGGDRVHDIALVQLRQAHGLPTARLGNSATLRIGQEVLSLGNAYGRGGMTVGPGEITGLHRSIASTTESPDEDSTDSRAGTADSGTATDTASAPRLTDVIQLETSMQPGMSGGPTVDKSGRVVALNVAYSMANGSRDPDGSGFAIPINTALRDAQRILAAQ
jgi:S1-C subfamily serine protease